MSQVSNLLSNFDLDGSAIVYNDSEEEVIEGNIVGEGDNLKVGANNREVNNMAGDKITAFEDEDAVDLEGALREACANLKNLPFEENDLDFWFNQAEIKMAAVGVKKNYTKFQVLTTAVPPKVINEVRPLLRRKETDFPNKDAYKQLKNAIIRIFGPRPEAAVDRALGRVLVDRPSMLARALVNDLCKNELDCACCPAIVTALWKRHLPSNVRSGIAKFVLTKQNFEQVIKEADDIYASNNPPPASAAVAAVMAPAAASRSALDETLPAIQYPVPEVSAVSRGGRGGRGYRGGGGRGGRGGRGGGNRGGGNRGGGQAAASGGQPRQYKGPKHPDLPSGDWTGCQLHYKWGRGAHFCAEPATCPWKNIYTPKQ